jgi:hypothetical protein
MRSAIKVVGRRFPAPPRMSAAAGARIWVYPRAASTNKKKRLQAQAQRAQAKDSRLNLFFILKPKARRRRRRRRRRRVLGLWNLAEGVLKAKG